MKFDLVVLGHKVMQVEAESRQKALDDVMSRLNLVESDWQDRFFDAVDARRVQSKADIAWERYKSRVASYTDEDKPVFVSAVEFAFGYEATQGQPRLTAVQRQSLLDQLLSFGPDRKISCIKFVRDLTDWGLRDAKEWVENNIRTFQK